MKSFWRTCGGHKLSEIRTEQANHVPDLAPNNPSHFVGPATKAYYYRGCSPNTRLAVELGFDMIGGIDICILYLYCVACIYGVYTQRWTDIPET